MNSLPSNLETTTFSDYMIRFFNDINPERVVEIGPDLQLKTASRLAAHCNEYIAVTLPDDANKAQFSSEMLGIPNLRIIGHNAVYLADVIPMADVVFLHNVLLDYTGEDTKTLWQYRRGEKPATPQHWDSLSRNFGKAAILGFKQFFAIAENGFVISFQRSSETKDKKDMLIEGIGISTDRIESFPLLYDEDTGRDTTWEIIIVNNKN